ncbi:hypothetical protein LWI28_017435 [Acer negundo]|uniref:Uncharacterized protein n=1 Tax=Acer negundo TaxID=4023 RepID=A0AAD5JI99_ACENE|nr:hypothetical protein LWI28_017435 [Acer negundo]
MVSKYLDSFPFPYYIVLMNIEALPRTLADLLRQNVTPFDDKPQSSSIDSPRQEQQQCQRFANLQMNRQSQKKVFGMAAANPQPLSEWRYRSRTRTAEHGMVVAAALTSGRHNR